MDLNVPVIPGIVLEQFKPICIDAQCKIRSLRLQLRIKGFDLRYWLCSETSAQQPYRIQVDVKHTSVQEWQPLIQYEPADDADNYPSMSFSIREPGEKEDYGEEIPHEMAEEIIGETRTVRTIEELEEALRGFAERAIEEAGQDYERHQQLYKTISAQKPELN